MFTRWMPVVVCAVAGLWPTPAPAKPPLPEPKLELAANDQVIARLPEGVAGLAYSPDGKVLAQITPDDFAKVDLRIARIESAELVEGADRLLKLGVDLGGERRTIFAGTTSPEAMATRTDDWARMINKVINLDTFAGKLDRDSAIAVYRRHNDDVRAVIAPERLLVIDSDATWEPLCRFLGVAVPDAPYPRENTTEKFQAMRAARAAELAAKAEGAAG